MTVKALQVVDLIGMGAMGSSTGLWLHRDIIVAIIKITKIKVIASSVLSALTCLPQGTANMGLTNIKYLHVMFSAHTITWTIYSSHIKAK